MADSPTYLYLAGPMRGIPEWNHPAFHVATERLRERGYVVFNPAEFDLEQGFNPTANGSTEGFDLRSALKADLSWICDNAEGIALLPAWEASLGVAAEMALAKALGVPVKLWTEWAEGVR